MKRKSINFIWGIVLVLAGILFLAQNTGWINELPDPVWKFIFAGLSLLFFATYFISGVKEWPWLFPACIFGVLSFITFLGEQQIDAPVFGSLIMWSIAVPFLVAYGADRKNNWWALIPAWVMTVIGGIIILESRIPEEIFAGLILLAIALPFFVVYLINRNNWWALIPAGVLAVVAFIPVLSSTASEDFLPVFIMAIIALPFFLVYSRAPQNWWALIPGGVLATIAVGVLVMLSVESNQNLVVRAGGVFFLGWGLTFGFLWLRRAVHGTDWAKWPAAILLVFALGLIVLGAGFDKLWPVLIIALGVVILYWNLTRKTTT